MNKLVEALEMIQNMTAEEFKRVEKTKKLDRKDYNTVSYLDNYFEIDLNLKEELCQEYKYPKRSLGNTYSLAA